MRPRVARRLARENYSQNGNNIRGEIIYGFGLRRVIRSIVFEK